MDNLYIFGTSITARSIWKFVSDYKLYNLKGFIVDPEYKDQDIYCQLPVYSITDLPKEFDKKNDYIFIGIEWDKLNSIRKKIFLRLQGDGYNFANIISPRSIIHSEIKGRNCFIGDGVIIENDVTINDNVYIKSNSVIQHLSIIDKHALINANCLISGGCHIGEQTYLGISSTIFNSVNIGKKCLVGACTYVKRHLPEYSVIKTKNDDFIIKNYPESEIENKLLASIRIR